MSDPTQDTPRSLRVSPTGLLPAVAVLSRTFGYALRILNGVLQPHASCDAWFGLFPFRSPLLWESRLIYSPRLLRCFSSPCDLPACAGLSDITRIGFPHSEIPGSKRAWLANRGLSQPAASFIGNRSQGIHSLPFVTYPRSSA